MINRDKEEIKSAIEILQHSNQLLLNHIELINNQKYLTNGGKYYRKIENCEVEYHAVNLAIEALEKRIPEKPHLDTIFPSGIEWFYCPTCRHNGIGRVERFCHNCGQALDWSDENE